MAVDLPPVAADGPLMAGYIPQESLAGFESLTGAGVLGGMSAGTALLVGAAAIGAGVAISNSSGGGGGGGSSVPPDTTPPKAASGLKIAPDGSSISGQAEAGASVGIDTNGDGKPDLTVIADANGNFTAPLNPPLTNGETVTVIVTDPAGNSSTPVTAEAPDFPDAPQVNASNGSVLSGTAEAGVTIVITDGNGNPIGQTSTDANGNWSFTPVANCRMAPWSMWWPGTPPATAARRPPSPSTAWRRARRWSSRATAANSAGLPNRAAA